MRLDKLFLFSSGRFIVDHDIEDRTNHYVPKIFVYFDVSVRVKRRYIDVIIVMSEDFSKNICLKDLLQQINGISKLAL